jgi:hypothetical protein
VVSVVGRMLGTSRTLTDDLYRIYIEHLCSFGPILKRGENDVERHCDILQRSGKMDGWSYPEEKIKYKKEWSQDKRELHRKKFLIRKWRLATDPKGFGRGLIKPTNLHINAYFKRFLRVKKRCYMDGPYQQILKDHKSLIFAWAIRRTKKSKVDNPNFEQISQMIGVSKTMVGFLCVEYIDHIANFGTILDRDKDINEYLQGLSIDIISKASK